MRTWLTSACVVLALGIVPVSLMAAGGQGPVHPAPASIGTGRHPERPPGILLTRAVRPAAVRPAAGAAAAAPAGSPARYAVQPGDTLSGIAARFAVRGG